MNKITKLKHNMLKYNITILGDIPLNKDGLVDYDEIYNCYDDDPDCINNFRTKSVNRTFSYLTLIWNTIAIHNKYSDEQKEEMLKEYFILKEII